MKKDKELWAVNILGVVCLATMIVLVHGNERVVADQPTVREVEHYVYQPVRHEEVPKAVEPFVVSKKTEYIYEATDEEKELMARVVMSEGSILPIEGKQAIAQTIVNRFRSSLFPNNIEEVIKQPYQYSMFDNGTPDAECYEAVEAALKYEGFPIDMYYFRTGHYHTFAEDYCQIGNTYFSTERSK